MNENYFIERGLSSATPSTCNLLVDSMMFFSECVCRYFISLKGNMGYKSCEFMNHAKSIIITLNCYNDCHLAYDYSDFTSIVFNISSLFTIVESVKVPSQNVEIMFTKFIEFSIQHRDRRC